MTKESSTTFSITRKVIWTTFSLGAAVMNMGAGSFREMFLPTPGVAFSAGVLALLPTMVRAQAQTHESLNVYTDRYRPEFFGFHRNNDGSSLQVGSAKDDDINVLLSLLNADGTVRASKTTMGAAQDQFNAVTRDSNGDYIACGETKKWSAGKNTKWVIMKLSFDLSVKWTKTFGVGQHEDRCHKIFVDDNNAIYASGTMAVNAAFQRDFVALKLAANGDELWSSAHGGNYHMDLSASALSPDQQTLCLAGNQHVTNRGFHDFAWMCLDSNDGQLKWSSTFETFQPTTNLNKMGNIGAIVFSKDGQELYGAGETTLETDGLSDQSIFHLRADGQALVWAMRLNQPGTGVLRDIDITPDGNLIFVGSEGNLPTVGFNDAITVGEINLTPALNWVKYWGTKSLNNGVAVEATSTGAMVVGNTRSWVDTTHLYGFVIQTNQTGYAASCSALSAVPLPILTALNTTARYKQTASSLQSRYNFTMLVNTPTVTLVDLALKQEEFCHQVIDLPTTQISPTTTGISQTTASVTAAATSTAATQQSPVTSGTTTPSVTATAIPAVLTSASDNLNSRNASVTTATGEVSNNTTPTSLAEMTEQQKNQTSSGAKLPEQAESFMSLSLGYIIGIAAAAVVVIAACVAFIVTCLMNKNRGDHARNKQSSVNIVALDDFDGAVLMEAASESGIGIYGPVPTNAAGNAPSHTGGTYDVVPAGAMEMSSARAIEDYDKAPGAPANAGTAMIQNNLYRTLALAPALDANAADNPQYDLASSALFGDDESVAEDGDVNTMPGRSRHALHATVSGSQRVATAAQTAPIYNGPPLSFS